jgi:hypothetical protein
LNLAAVSLPIAGSFILNLDISIPFLDCPLLRYVGIPCPAWGLTRSFMAIARGDWQQAIAFHGLGIAIFAGLAIAALHLSLEIYFYRRITAFYEKLIRKDEFILFAASLLWIYHGHRLWELWKAGF